MIIPVLRQTPFNFSYLVSPSTESVIVADRIPVAGARIVTLSVRIHRLTLSSGASFNFLVHGVNPSATDGTVFITSSLASTGAITSSNPNLVGLSSTLSDPQHPYVRVVLQATGPSSAGTTYFELSADLVLQPVCECDVCNEWEVDEHGHARSKRKKTIKLNVNSRTTIPKPDF